MKKKNRLRILSRKEGIFVKRKVLVAMLLTLSSAGAFADEPKIALTIYSAVNPVNVNIDYFHLPANYPLPGYAMVKDQREIDLKQGQNVVNFPFMTTNVDPTTVNFKSLTDPDGTMVVEQDYQFDLTNNQRLLERYLGQEITIEQSLGDRLNSITGKLLSIGGGLALQDKNNNIISTNNYLNIRFPDIKETIFVKPTLVWTINTNKPGKHQVETRYQTNGITWWANYNATYSEGAEPNKGLLDLTAWATITNKSGMDFDNANLQLIAGDVNQVAPRVFARAQTLMAGSASPSANMSFKEKPISEYHSYTLDKPVSISNNSIKQIELFPKVSKIPVEKQYIYKADESIYYYGQMVTERSIGVQTNNKVDIYLKFMNSQEFGLGYALPAGKVRISQSENKENNNLSFVGEDNIDHTPKNAKVEIKVGSAFDITGDRKQINFTIDANRQIMEETYEITLKNSKDQDVTVLVKENIFRGPGWSIINNTIQFDKLDSQTIQFAVLVGKNSEKKLRYTVKYTW